MKSQRVTSLFVAVCAFLAVAPLAAEEIVGEIGAVDEQAVAVLVSGTLEPLPGDKFIVTVEVPEVGEATIAQGQVTAIDDGIVIGRILTATGKVAVGQKVKIDSPQPVRKRTAPAAAEPIHGKVGAVVDLEITIVTTSTFDPAVGDRVEVFGEVPGGSSTSVGVGKVTALQGGLTIARIEQATGTLAFGQQVLISLANPPAVAATPGGEVLGLKLDPVDAAVAELLDLPKTAGLVVRNVAPGSLADTAGLKKRDVLLRAGGAELNDREQFLATIRNAGRELRLEIWREGTAQAVVLALPVQSSTPGNAASPAGAARDVPAVWIGLEIENFRDDVRVRTVIPGSPAARAGFRSDDHLMTLDGEEVLDGVLFVRAVSSGATGKARRIEVTRGAERLTFELLPEPKPTDEQLFARMKKLAEAGDHNAEHQLAMMYSGGLGIPDPDPVAARRWLRAAAEAGVPVAQSGYGEFLLHGTGGETNAPEAVAWIRKAAEQHWSNAFLSLGQIYRLGLGVEKNEAEARHWFGRALEQESLRALLQIGQLYELGELYEQDLPKAAEFYRTAAHRGYPAAQTEWGRCLAYGIGVGQDYQAAVRWFRTASDAGDPPGHFALANLYSSGQGVAQDREAAVNLFRKAAALGHEGAMFNLGVIYGNGMGVLADDAESYRWLKAAADRGYVDAFTELGFLHQQGRGVPQSDEQAVAWYRKAAEAGHDLGQYNLSIMLRDGRGAEKNDKEAMQWAHKAALQKLPEAEYEMGVIAYEGRGVNKVLETAFVWYKASAGHGYAQAQYGLGFLYENGQGVAASQSEAIKWYERAAAQNDALSLDALKRLGQR